MKWLHIKAIFESENIDLAGELVAEIFFSIGLNGVECNIPIPGSCFNKNIKENYIAAYIPATDLSGEKLKKIKTKALLLKNQAINVKITTSIVDEQEWAESWKEFFHVTRITDRIVVKPEWREYAAENNEIVINIDPGMAFGTGTHPTTALCLQMMEQYIKKGCSFLDVGTGSGILMIAGARLGAEYGTGIDNDEIAVKIAKENLRKNNIDSERFKIELNTITTPEGAFKSSRFDIICVNILAHIIIDIMPFIFRLLNPGGMAILSGIIKEKEKPVLNCIQENRLKIVDIIPKEEWVAISVKSPLP